MNYTMHNGCKTLGCTRHESFGRECDRSKSGEKHGRAPATASTAHGTHEKANGHAKACTKSNAFTTAHGRAPATAKLHIAMEGYWQEYAFMAERHQAKT